jgi:hypothetical protein
MAARQEMGRGGGVEISVEWSRRRWVDSVCVLLIYRVGKTKSGAILWDTCRNETWKVCARRGARVRGDGGI